MTPVLLSILAGAGTAALHDLIGYQRARTAWAADPDAHVIPPPAFDWVLFATRLAIGVITGALTGLGINHTIGGPS